VLKTENTPDEFVLVEAENLSYADEFMQHEPQNWRQEQAKSLIGEAISSGVKNFYKPKCDPSITSDGKGIIFKPGKIPAVSKSFKWWNKMAKKYNPERSSRLGTRLEYGAFLGVLIKQLIAEGNAVEWAWNAVCNNSSELGNYWNSEKVAHVIEPTGSREICGFFDLANVYKILAKNEGSRWFALAGGSCVDYSHVAPIAHVCYSNAANQIYNCGVGWIVCS